jgi:glycosyltransferase involved in cell wall biosynthesis
MVELKHRISDSELIDILNRARLMLYAPRLEPFGFAPLEACAWGLPVVAVAEGGVRETIKDGVNGILVEHKPDRMAAAIERLMLDSDIHNRLSAHGQELAKTAWSLGAAIDRLEKRLQAHVNEHCRPTNDDIKVDSVPA